jgi:hypothetical protein
MRGVDMDLSGVNWFKSSRSSAGKDCVETAFLDGGLVGVRDSKNPTAGALVFSPTEWDAFAAGIQAGRYDLA